MVGASDGGVPKSGEKREGRGSHPELDASTPQSTVAISDPLAGLVSVVPEDEEGAEETRVQAQPPNFAELAESFVPVGEILRTPSVDVGSVDEEDTRRAHAHRLPRLDSRPPDDDSGKPTAILVSPEADKSLASPYARNVMPAVRRGPAFATAHAEQLDAHSDSGLRRTEQNLPSGDQPILGLPLSSSGNRPMAFDVPSSSETPFFGGPQSSGVVRQASWEAPPPSFAQMPPSAVLPRGLEPTRAPSFSSRYDVRVIVVAVLSFAIPFGLFLYLYNLLDRSQPSDSRPAATEVAPESPGR